MEQFFRFRHLSCGEVGVTVRGRSQQTIKSVTPVAPTRAAAYVRMSSRNQRYSIANQMKVIRKYAEKHGIEIVKVYQDAAKSGLTIDGRDALAKLFVDVLFRQQDFEEILVYDVSRWGRFQDIDESAYYEFLCKKSGVRVTYCEELFVNDGTAYQSIAKSWKRAMAAEQSRERSARVMATRLHIASLGFYPGGDAAYGIARVAVDAKGRRRQVLKRGHLRSVRTDHLLLAPGPQREVRVIRDIFRMYVEEKLSANEIARRLNAKRIPSPKKRQWSLTTVLYILSNALYVGRLHYNRTATRMRKRMGRTDRSRWITIEGITKPIVDERTFARAQRIRKSRITRKSDQRLLDELRVAIDKLGPLPARKLHSKLRLSCQTTYTKRFGSLQNAYRLLGKPLPPSSYIWERALRIRQMRTQILHTIKGQLESRGVLMELSGYGRYFQIDGKLTGYLDLPYSTMTYRGQPCWRMRLPERSRADFYIIGLLAGERCMPFEYYLVPATAIPRWSFQLRGRKKWPDRHKYLKLLPLIEALVAYARAAAT